MSEWKNFCLGDVVEFNPAEKIVKGTLAKKIAMEKLQPFCRTVTGYEVEKYNGGVKFRNDDTIMARITPCLENGKTAKVAVLDDGEIGFGSTEYIVFRAKKNLTVPDFVYYLIRSEVVREPAIKSMVGTSGRQRVQTDYVRNIVINLPPLDTQKKIAAVLSALDDKIELNNAINKNLEEQAQAIFDEFYRKADEEVFLGKTCKCELGGTPSRKNLEYWNGNISWINSGEVNKFRIIEPSEKITELGLKKSATKLLPAKTTVIAITGATLGQVSLLEIESCANQSVVGIIPNKKIPYEYIYPLVKMKISELLTHQTGGAQQHINKRNVEDLSIKILSPNFMKKYLSIVSGIYELISNICFENQKLGELRDALLPKLMSGEIDVSAVEI